MSEWIAVRVAEKRDEARDIASFVLEKADGTDLPHWEPGAHVDVRLPGDIVRQYSLCGPAVDTRRYRIGVLRDSAGRGGSRAIHDDVAAGDTLSISPPRNLFPLDVQEQALLFAGGIGITPILAMAHHLSAKGDRFDMHYCVRSADRAAFADQLGGDDFAGRVSLHCDDDPDTRLDVDALLGGTPVVGTHIYVCGPDGFMDHVLNAAKKAGWPDSQVHFERFSAPVSQPGEDGAFKIAVEGSDRVIEVAAGQSAIDALAAAGIEIPVSCEQGICGTCLTDIAGGIPDHRDMFLSDAEKAANDCFTPCCSRALTPRLTIRI
ncbi:PDR/VanB family oxidoreductase [Croceicoccus sediminis]|uniref:PDR/VanB family oxidoreductase n=1 Tax=Croceicoccus sediminis TaxID=2571150 RepID=UPI001181CDA9|nr:PDR/VanB family oxidoreductase [Croceicoccus sediminis]